MPELREALGSFRPTSNGSDGNMVPMFTASLRDTFNAADRSTEAIPPAMFVQVCVSAVCYGGYNASPLTELSYIFVSASCVLSFSPWRPFCSLALSGSLPAGVCAAAQRNPMAAEC